MKPRQGQEKPEASKSHVNSPTMNIYVISYNRAESTIVHKLLEYCTYVVRKSQEEQYLKLGVDVLAVDDEKINSFAKVNNWLLDNPPCDVAAVLDDDISWFTYLNMGYDHVTDIVTPTIEIERMCQLTYDLDVALLGSPVVPIPYKYNEPFSFSGMVGPLRIYNFKHIKSRYPEIKFFGDTDFVLQELLKNRIILRPNYFVPKAKLEKNKGGMNITRNKKIQDELAASMKVKWGKYFVFRNKGFLDNVTRIMVAR